MATVLWVRRESPISLSDWLSFLADRPLLGVCHEITATNPATGDVLRVAGEWVGPLRNGETKPVFNWRDGQIGFKYHAVDDDDIRQLITEICTHFGALIEDEEGNTYSVEALKSVRGRR